MVRGPKLTGELVELRPIEGRDAARLFEATQDEEGMRLTGTAVSFTREQIEDWANTVSDRPDRFDYAMTSLIPNKDGEVDDSLIGEIVINEIDELTRSANLRLQSLPDYRGRGYGREAISLMLQFAFAPAPQGLGLHRLSLDVLSINPRARMLYESLGFVQEGVLRDAASDGEGGLCDAIIMSILEDEYDPQR